MFCLDSLVTAASGVPDSGKEAPGYEYNRNLLDCLLFCTYCGQAFLFHPSPLPDLSNSLHLTAGEWIVQGQLKGKRASSGESEGVCLCPSEKAGHVGEGSGRGEVGSGFQCPAGGGSQCPRVNTPHCRAQSRFPGPRGTSCLHQGTLTVSTHPSSQGFSLSLGMEAMQGCSPHF